MNLERSIALRWEESTALNRALPVDRFFSGRVPTTEEYKFPYCSLIVTRGSRGPRTDKGQYPRLTVSFHVWVDDSREAEGLDIANKIGEVFADQLWTLDEEWAVLDVLDEGRAIPHQTNVSTFKTWEIIKLFTFVLARRRLPAEFSIG
jgi:hypothetical protein